MAGKKPNIVVTRKLPDQVEGRMEELFSVKRNSSDEPFSHAQLVEAVKNADCLVPTVTDKIDHSIISEAGVQLKIIANFGNGVDNIDVAAAAERGITVTNTPNVLTEDTADMTMGLMIAVARRIDEGVEALQNGEFEGWSPTWMLGHRIWGKQLGIIGMGRIGTAVARRAKAFGLSIHYHNRNPVSEKVEQELEATYWDSLDNMLSHCDIISVNCPHTPATYHLISALRIEMMKENAVIINTARGEIIDQNALIDALCDNKIAGAGLDVFKHEPAVSPKLLALSKEGKAIILPHMGSATFESRIEMGERVIINIKTLFDGHRPPDRVLPIIN